jgi:hypothetical protein
VVIGVLETAQVVCFAVAAAQLRQRVNSTTGLLALFVIFPVTFFAANFGAGAAVIIGIHAQHTTRLLVTLTTLVSIGWAATLIRLAASFVPAEAQRAEPENATAGGVVGRLNAVKTAQ